MIRLIPDDALMALAQDWHWGTDGPMPEAARDAEIRDLARELVALRAAARRVGGWGMSAAPYNCKCGWIMPVCNSPSKMSEAWAEHAEDCAIEALRALLPEDVK